MHLTYLLLYIGRTTSKEGSPKYCSNYRTIALISHASEMILLIIIRDRLRQKFQNELYDEQAGFRRTRDASGMISYIQNVIEYTLQMSERTCTVIFDYSKAFTALATSICLTYLMTWGVPDISLH